MKRSAVLFIAAIGLLATSCKKTPDAAKIPISPPSDSVHQQLGETSPFQAQLDSGNVAYRAKDYTRAREHYTRATEADSTVAAGWYGVYMAEDKLGNRAAADYAMKRASALNPEFDSMNPHGAAPKKEVGT